jgi:hypothetical protein
LATCPKCHYSPFLAEIDRLLVMWQSGQSFGRQSFDAEMPETVGVGGGAVFQGDVAANVLSLLAEVLGCASRLVVQC